MDIYDAIYNRRITSDFQDKIVPDEILEKIINAGLQAPTHDHLRNWEFVILKDKQDKEQALQFIKQGVKPQLEILKQTLINGTPSKKCMLMQCQNNIRCYTTLRILFFRSSNQIQEFFTPHLSAR